MGLSITSADTEINSSKEKAVKSAERELAGLVYNNVNKKPEEKLDIQQKTVISSYRALWFIDEKNNVCLRIEDENGNVVKQIPPEEILNLREKLKEISKNIFNLEA
ncbi:MAG: flagellar protein FlaG [Proteobacteria bacterium]|nr:flagellar protein FlaG [Pseudomonadota bacterium]